MNTKLLDGIRNKRAKAAENSRKAQEFIQGKENEIRNLKERFNQASAALDTDEYITLMQQIADRERELTALKEIAGKSSEITGYTDTDVQEAFARYCADYNPMIAKKIRAYNEKKDELMKLYLEMAELQKQAILIRNEFKEYLINQSARLDKLTIIPNWGRHLCTLFYGDLPEYDQYQNNAKISEFCWNAERFNQ